MQTVRTAFAIGLSAQFALLAVLAASVGLSLPGWLVGIACGLTVNAALASGLTRSGATALGAANQVTLIRATLVGGVAALVANAFVRPASVPALVTLATVALVLDAVDGRVARRTEAASALGARFDMEVDAFLILVLSAYVARSAGQWVLAIGAARYAFGGAGWRLPWLRAQVPPRYWRKTVAAIQGIVLTVAAAGLLPDAVAETALVAALALLAESFGRDVWWLWRHARAEAHGTAEPEQAPTDAGDRRRVRTVAGWVTTALAVLLVWFALVGPNQLGRLTPAAFVRVPIEGLVVAAVCLVVPALARTALAATVGLVLGLLTVLKILDMAFYDQLDRPFNPVTDWGTFGPALGVVRDSVGSGWADVAVIGAVLLGVAVVVLAPLAVVRLTRLSGRHRVASARALGAVGVVWVLCAALGVRFVSGAPIASTSAAALAYDQVGAVHAAIQDQHRFTSALGAHDPFRDTPASDLLTGLRGKDVIVAFIESYGRVAVQDSAFSPQVDTVLNAGTGELRAAGFDSRSAFLTSPTFGGISWLAHSTLQSGLWINGQQRYNRLVASDRFTLSDAFKRAGWRTVGDVPSNGPNWHEGKSFYHYDKLYNATNVGYAGPRFSYATMPDQYIYSAFQRRELAAPHHQPVMAEIDLVSSHTPWAPLPRMVDWNQVGDGSVFDGMPAQGRSPGEVWRHSDQVKAAYGQSIQYSMSALISFVQKSDDKNLVLVVLGDHQPATIVSGSNASHDVPISIIARDPQVLDRISSWGGQDGMLPSPDAPVWPMDTFRDRFLTAYGPRLPAPSPSSSAARH